LLTIQEKIRRKNTCSYFKIIGGNPEDIASIGRWCQDMATDNVANVIISISDPTVSYKLTLAPDVQTFLWVPDLNYDEAKLYLHKSGFENKYFNQMTAQEKKDWELSAQAKSYQELSEIERVRFDAFYEKKLEKIFGKLGTRFSTIIALSQSNTRVEKFIYRRILSCEERIDDLLRQGQSSEWRQVLTSLLEKDLSILEVKNITNLPSSQITPLLRDYGVLTFNPDTEKITYYSTTARTAAKEYLTATRTYWDSIFRNKKQTGSVISPPTDFSEEAQNLVTQNTNQK